MKPLVLFVSMRVLSVPIRVNLCGQTCIHVCTHPNCIYCMYEFSFCISRQWMSPQGNTSAWQEMDLIGQEVFCISSHCVFRNKL